MKLQRCIHFDCQPGKAFLMKYAFSIISACLVIVAACRKSGHSSPLPEDRGCVERVVIPVSAHSINAADVPVINNLFSKNGIDNSRFRYYRHIHDTLKTQYPPFRWYDMHVVRLDQYTNGLPVFYGEMIFHFLDDSLSYLSDNVTKGTSLDTIPRLNLFQLRKLFLHTVERFDHNSDQYRDVCIKCEFGYYDQNVSKYGEPEQLVKAWRVTPKNSEYPFAYFTDEGVFISYDNGIRTFR